MEPFIVRDCALLEYNSPVQPAVNLRELRERIETCPANALFHHFCETTMTPYFDNPDYRNDFAVWIRKMLGDRVLSEQIGIIDPYAFDSIDALRTAVLDLIDDRLSVESHVYSVPPGDEFFFKEAVTIVFDTGDLIRHPSEMKEAVSRMSKGSIYFHFIEARRRPPILVDDFSAWLEQKGDAYKGLIARLRAVDFYFYPLTDLREELILILGNEDLPDVKQAV